jgi:ATP-dependent DNA helicase RecG
MELKEQIGTSEGETLEWKERINLDAIARTICAFLNGKGGRIVVGVSDQGTPVGLRIADKELASLEKNLRDAISPAGSWSFVRTNVGDQQLLLIDVSSGGQKPYLVGGTIWTRRDSTTAPATHKDIDRLIRQRARLEERWERRPAMGVKLSDLDHSELRTAIKDIERRGHHHFAESATPEAALNELSLTVDGEPTNAAVVLFGQSPAMIYPQTMIRVVGYATDKTGPQLTFSEQLQGHLFGSLARIEAILKERVSVSSDFVQGKLRRQDWPEYPFGALREGLMNALVHRDFENIAGGMTLSFFPNRFEIWNAGQLPDGLTPAGLRRDHPSLPRNPDVAHICFLRGLIERVGRGTQLIARECAAAGLKPPQWKSDPLGTRLTFYGRRGLLPTHSDLNRRQQVFLKKVKRNQEITVAEALILLQPEHVTDRTVRTDLAALVRGGYFVQAGKGRSTTYRRTDVGTP